MLRIKSVMRGRLLCGWVYIMAKRNVSCSERFNKLSRHFQTHDASMSKTTASAFAEQMKVRGSSFPVCMKRVKFSFQINVYELQVSKQILIKYALQWLNKTPT